jgi:hypothetical protein
MSEIRGRIDQNLLAALTLFVLLASCSPGPQAGGGIGGTGSIASIASGPITGFGSVFVSGTEYETTDTSMMVDGQPGSQRDLKQGMLVRVNATVTERSGTTDPPLRTANTLLYEDTLEGFVQSVTPTGSHLVVLGQSVTITPATLIDASIPGGNVLNLVPGRDLVEVSGFVTGDGTILGTFIELKTLDMNTQTPDYEVKGFVKNHKAAKKTFEIGALTIDYSDATLNDMPGQLGDDWNGLLVDARGSQVSPGSSGLFSVRMRATLVWPEGLGTEDSADSKVEGIVTQVRSPGDFFLGNLHVLTSVDTIFEGGAPDDILVGAHLEVHGPLVGGLVKATKVELEESQIKGTVTQVLSPGDFFLGGLHVLTNVGTIFEGGTPHDTAVGAHLEVYGLPVGGVMKATKVEFERETQLHAQVHTTNSRDNILP